MFIAQRKKQMPSSNDCYPNYPEACEVVIPITLKIPVMVQPEVIGKPPVCNTYNGNGNGYKSDSQPKPQPESQPAA